MKKAKQQYEKPVDESAGFSYCCLACKLKDILINLYAVNCFLHSMFLYSRHF